MLPHRRPCLLVLTIGAILPLCAEDGPAAPDPVAPVPAAPSAPAINRERMFGVMPDYQTVRDPTAHFVPLTNAEKWKMVGLSTVDPFNLASAVLGAGLSQAGNDTPRYGWGGEAYGRRLGAALADFATQNAFSGALGVLLHQDPRYFRKGPGAGIPRRVVYSLTRLVVARSDSGAMTFNSSGIFGMALGIAASNAYYPSASRTGNVMLGRIQTSLTGDIIGNLMSEFWPDIQRKFFHRRHRP